MKQLPLLLALVGITTPLFAAQPPWCQNRLNEVERTICHTPTLWEADNRLTEVFSQQRDSLSRSEKARLTNEQRRWLGQRNAQCLRSVAACLAAYEERIAELDSQNYRSVYTRLTDCRVIESSANDPNAEIDYFSNECPGKENYRIFHEGMDSRSWLVIKKGSEMVIDLRDAVMQNAPGNFPTVSEKVAEWRYQGKTPIAFIFRIVGTEEIYQLDHSNRFIKTNLNLLLLG